MAPILRIGDGDDTPWEDTPWKEPSVGAKILRVGDWEPTPACSYFVQFGAFPTTVIIEWGSTTKAHFTRDPIQYFKQTKRCTKIEFRANRKRIAMKNQLRRMLDHYLQFLQRYQHYTQHYGWWEHRQTEAF